MANIMLSLIYRRKVFFKVIFFSLRILEENNDKPKKDRDMDKRR